MSWRYSCPRCEASLNPKDYIILVGGPSGGERRCLVGFHPQPGNYELHLPPGTELEEGQRWDFSCPVCHGDLTAADDDKLCALDMLDAEGQRRQVLFSRIAGDKATFVVADRRIEHQFGEGAREYALHLIHLKDVIQ